MRSLAILAATAWLSLATLAFDNVAQKPLGRPVWPVPKTIPGWTTGEPFPSLIDATIDDLTAALEAGLFTSVELVKAYIERIDQVNATVQAVTEVNPESLDIAAALDRERAAGRLRGPLHGIPILLKNNIATNDTMNNTAGSWLLVGATVPRDSTVARKLREAGAILLGKANLSQWAGGRSPMATNGWSAHGGQTIGAYHHKQDPGGSSSGSAVAVDLGLTAAALGTETDGSIVYPSHMNGIVGIKPTVGLTSRHLVIPLSEHQDTVGPMAKTVRDAARVLQAIAGHDRRDNYTTAIPQIEDYVAACDYDSLRGARLGVPWNVFDTESGNVSTIEMGAFRGALDELSAAGASIITANFSSNQDRWETKSESVLVDADFTTNLAMYLAELTHNPSGIRTIADVTSATRNHPLEAYPALGTEILDRIVHRGINNSDPQAWAAYQDLQRLGGPGGLLGALHAHSLDAIVMPTVMAPPWAAIVGAPVVNVPIGHFPHDAPVVKDRSGRVVRAGPGMPIGMSFLGRRWAEVDLIGLAFAYEQRSNVRLIPVQRVIQPCAEV